MTCKEMREAITAMQHRLADLENVATSPTAKDLLSTAREHLRLALDDLGLLKF